MRRFIAAVSLAALAVPVLAYEDGPPRFKDRAPLEQTQPDRRPVGVRDPAPNAPGSAGATAGTPSRGVRENDHNFIAPPR
jgi:hypothetical protein